MQVGQHRRSARQLGRREAIRASFGIGVAGITLAALSACGGEDVPSSPTPTPTPTAPSTGITAAQRQSDYDVWHFAETLGYLEAQFHSYSAFGVGIDPALAQGATTVGTVRGGATVAFTDETLARFARETALNRIDHLRILRAFMDGRTANGDLAVGSVSQPTLDLSGGTGGAFDTAFRAAGVLAAGETFNPYSNDDSWLLAAYFLSDVVSSAYRAAIAKLNQAPWRDAAAGLFASAAYTSGGLRTLILLRGVSAPVLLENARRLSELRDQLDGAADQDQAPSEDGIGPNFVPAGVDGQLLGRNPSQTLNILYLTRQRVTRGGFFPEGISGNLRESSLA